MLNLIESVRKLFKTKGARFSLKELAEVLTLRGDELEVLKLALNELELCGEIYLNDSQEYIPFPKDQNLAIGQLRFDKRRNPFVLIGHSMVFIPENHLNGAIKGDTVLIRRNNFVGMGETKTVVTKILNRQHHFIIFECYKNQGKKRVRPYNSPFKCHISLSKKDWDSISVGDRFGVQVDKVNHNGIFHGDISFKIGSKNDPFLPLKTIAASHGIRIDFPEEVNLEAEEIPTTIREEKIEEEIRNGRVDLRKKIIFTIDGEHSKDLDDAVSLEINDKGNYVLGVHIADVAYYVKEGTAIQKEAALRGTSYYFSTLVIPMLPPTLSNGICSLNPNQDRFTRTTEIEINPMGEILNFKQYKSIIHSKKKMTYESINQIFEEGISLEEYQTFIPTLRNMFQLSSILEKKKEQRGYINFGTEDFFITTDENGKPKEILPRKRGMAEKLIENFMLLANEITAIYQQNMQFLNQELPFIYRVHGYPDEKRIAEIITYLKNSGFYIEEKDYHDPKEFQLLLKSLATLPAFPAISDVLIRGLSKAKYSVNNIGHYGLALGYYTHSTSPIRRYSDLQTQYNMDKYTEQDLSRIDMEEQADKIIQICKHTTKVEKIADVTDRDITGYQFVQYMENKIGQTFTGMITYISKHHIIVRTTNYVIGTIETNELLDRGYKLIDQGTTLFDPKTKKHLRIGDLIEVVLKQTSLEDRKILFSIPNSKEKVYKKNSLLP